MEPTISDLDSGPPGAEGWEAGAHPAQPQEVPMTPIPLTVATGPSDATRALYDGSVGIDGATLTMRSGRTLSEVFERMMSQHEFDVSELGWTFYLRHFSAEQT